MSWKERRQERSRRRCRNFRRMKFSQKSFWVAVVLFVVVPVVGQFATDAGIIKSFVSGGLVANLVLLGFFSIVGSAIAWFVYDYDHRRTNCRCDDLEHFAGELEDLKRRVGALELK